MSYFIHDLKRNNRNPITLSSILTYRFGNFIYYRIKVPIFKQILWLLYCLLDLIIVRAIGGGEIPAKAKIGKGIKFQHSVNGVILHPDTIIGENVTIMHQVTLGAIHVNGNNVPPQIGDGVFIGAGAKVIGDITIGNKAKIGTNAVVLKSVPEYATAVGNPARNLLKRTS